MNDCPTGGAVKEKARPGMHDIGRQIIMGGSSGQTAIVTTKTTNGLSTTGLETTNSSGTLPNNPSNGIHHRPTQVTPRDAATATGAVTNSTGSAFLNNNCLKRSPVIKCSSTSEEPVGELANKTHAPHVTMSDDGPDHPSPSTVSVHDHCPDSVPVTVSSSSSSSDGSSQSSSLSTSPNPMMLIRGPEEADVDIGDPRKVEPLKINLHREPIRTVIKLGGQSPEVSSLLANHVQGSPKITIKPIPTPVPVVSSSDEPAEHEDVIPKLHLRMNHHGDVTTSPETTASTVPKLTIRNATTSTAVAASSPASTAAVGNTVPKLTIKMAQPVPKLTIKTNSLGGHAIGGEGAATNEHQTVPKLTIKVTNEPSSSTCALSPVSSVISSSTGNSCSSSAADGASLKLTLKNVSKEQAKEPGKAEEEKTSFQIMNSSSSPQKNIAPFRVALTHPPHCELPSEGDDNGEDEEEEESSERSNSEVEDAKISRPRIPKLTIKPVVGQPTSEVPKLVIKSLPKSEHCGVGGVAALGGGDGQYHNRLGPVSDVLPLDVCTAAGGHGVGGPQSPRIILKINKNQNSIVSHTTEGGEENLLKRHLTQEHANSLPKRSKAEERIVAVIDLDEESSKSSSGGVEESEVEPEATDRRNGRATSRQLLGASHEEGTPQCAVNNSVGSHGTAAVVKRKVGEVHTKNCTQIVPGDQTGGGDGESHAEDNDVVDEAAMRLQGPLGGSVDEIQTPVVKRGRGRPRKTPMVARDLLENSSSAVTNVPETSKKRGRKKREFERETQVPAAESVSNVASDEDESLPSPAAFGSATRKPRGGGRGGTRTPSSRGGGSRRGRGSARKPFNKQQYFKQKTFEESILNSYFEEDTRMSAADSSLSTTKVTVSLASQNDPQDSVSQSSHLSSASVTMDSTQTSSLSVRKKLKMEPVGTMEGKVEFTVDMLAEYEWPPGVGCCPNKNRDTYMIQEQIAEYLGVKSFKRKYPDLERRTVEMEERNHLIERGLVTEKMCDLGVTAVYAVDVLDIMHQDFNEKFEQYKKFHREKLVKDLTLRQKLNKGEFAIGAREKAMRSVSKWNASLNKTRKEDRRIHMDLQNFTIQVPEAKRKNMTYPTPKPPLYPVALVVGQFSEYYRTISPLELQCYPINTALTSPDDLMKQILEEKMAKRRVEAAAVTTEEETAAKGSSESSSSVDSDGDESVDSSSSESDCDVHDDDTCCVCAQSQFTSPNHIPELFVKCSVCMKVAHPSCIEMTSEMAKRAFQYQWQCVECKRCECCQKADDQQKIIYCQQCDRAYHIYCTQSLQSIPKGAWNCDICSICRKCGCRNPDGTNNKIVKQQPQFGSPSQHQNHRRAIAEWKHEFVKNQATRLKEHCGMLCVRCAAAAASLPSL